MTATLQPQPAPTTTTAPMAYDAVIRAVREKSRADHLTFVRRHLGWGIFVLRQA